MKINEKIINNSKINLIDFTNCPISTKYYEESSMKKNNILYQNEKYLLKYMEKNIAKHYKVSDNQITYFNSIYSEYISCNIAKLLGLNVQEIFLGYEKDEKEPSKYIPCVACKNFCDVAENIISFDTIYKIISKEENKNYDKRDLNDVLEIISKQNFIDKDKFRDFFIEMFLFDAFIGNFDRNLKNFGILENQITNSYKISPIYDYASSLHPKASKLRIKKIEESFYKNQINLEKEALFKPKSYFTINKERINYYDFFINSNYDKNIFSKSILKLFPQIIKIKENGQINKLIDDLEGLISKERIEIIKMELNYKIEKIIIPILEKELAKNKDFSDDFNR